ncbi:unnamed protein product [Lepeophtheirus salmonis]|nr:unnamed protein product [Lepeophtheirus salmonis]CAF3040584.1 unnamed protein product [Lepeophtheirus salmonis]
MSAHIITEVNNRVFRNVFEKKGIEHDIRLIKQSESPEEEACLGTECRGGWKIEALTAKSSQLPNDDVEGQNIYNQSEDLFDCLQKLVIASMTVGLLGIGVAVVFLMEYFMSYDSGRIQHQSEAAFKGLLEEYDALATTRSIYLFEIGLYISRIIQMVTINVESGPPLPNFQANQGAAFNVWTRFYYAMGVRLGSSFLKYHQYAMGVSQAEKQLVARCSPVFDADSWRVIVYSLQVYKDRQYIPRFQSRQINGAFREVVILSNMHQMPGGFQWDDELTCPVFLRVVERGSKVDEATGGILLPTYVQGLNLARASVVLELLLGLNQADEKAEVKGKTVLAPPNQRWMNKTARNSGQNSKRKRKRRCRTSAPQTKTNDDNSSGDDGGDEEVAVDADQEEVEPQPNRQPAEAAKEQAGDNAKRNTLASGQGKGSSSKRGKAAEKTTRVEAVLTEEPESEVEPDETQQRLITSQQIDDEIAKISEHLEQSE